MDTGSGLWLFLAHQISPALRLDGAKHPRPAFIERKQKLVLVGLSRSFRSMESTDWSSLGIADRKHMDVSKNRGKTPKMDGENNGKPY